MSLWSVPLNSPGGSTVQWAVVRGLLCSFSFERANRESFRTVWKPVGHKSWGTTGPAHRRSRSVNSWKYVSTGSHRGWGPVCPQSRWLSGNLAVSPRSAWWLRLWFPGLAGSLSRFVQVVYHSCVHHRFKCVRLFLAHFNAKPTPWKELINRWDRRTLRVNSNYRLNHAMIVKHNHYYTQFPRNARLAYHIGESRLFQRIVILIIAPYKYSFLLTYWWVSFW